MKFVIQTIEDEGSQVKNPAGPNHHDDAGSLQSVDSTIDISQLELILQAGKGPDSQPLKKYNFRNACIDCIKTIKKIF